LAIDGFFVVPIYHFMLATGWRLLGRTVPENQP
jgi:hypothetical protein